MLNYEEKFRCDDAELITRDIYFPELPDDEKIFGKKSF